MRAISASRVAHRVEAFALAARVGAAAARLAEIDVAGQLAHDHDVEARRRPRASASTRAASSGYSSAGRRFANSAERLADARGSPARAASRAAACRIAGRRPRRQHRVGRAARASSVASGSGSPARVVAGAADRRLLRSRSAGRRAAARRAPCTASRDDLGADAVARQDRDLHRACACATARSGARSVEFTARAARACRFASNARISSACCSVSPMSSSRSAGSACGTDRRRTRTTAPPSGVATRLLRRDRSSA